MEIVTTVQNPDEAVCISHYANIFGQGMHQTFVCLPMEKE